MSYEILHFARSPPPGHFTPWCSSGRQCLELIDTLVRELTGRGVAVQFVKEQLTLTAEDAPMATLLLSVLGAFAEFERANWSRAPAGRRLGPPSPRPEAHRRNGSERASAQAPSG